MTSANLGVYSYQNMNFSLCRILIPVMNGTIPANTNFPPPFQDNIWDFITLSAYAADVEQHLFKPAGVSGPTFTHPDPDALGYAFPPDTGWQARHQLTANDYQATFNKLTSQGFSPVLVSRYATPAGPRFACIFQQSPTGPWVARHNLTGAQYQASFDQFTGQGFALDWVSGYFDGGQDLYAAIWRQLPGAPAWQARHGLTSTQYQTAFYELVGQGFRLELVNGYSVGGQDRFAAIWTK